MNSDSVAGRARAELMQRAEQWFGHYERLAAKHCIEREAADLIRDLLAGLGETVPQRMFPIQGGPAIPWAVIAPFEKQAEYNHDQSLERLAERGGLCCSEAIDVLNGDKWATCQLRGKAAIDALLVRVAELQKLQVAETVPSSQTLDFIQARQQLAYWWFEIGRCPCGARKGSERTHPHVSGCPTADALTAAPVLPAQEPPQTEDQ